MSSPDRAEGQAAPATQRLFFALWPDVTLRERLHRLGRKLIHKNGKLVAPENLHITLLFLGSLDEERAACVRAAADAVRLGACTLRLECLGHFRRPQVLWVGPAETPPALAQLVQGLGERVGACGVALEARPFRAHLTLARKVAKPPPVLETDPLDFPVTEYTLVRSRTLPEGARYEVIARWPLEEAQGWAGG
jgi:RNA 2',3'-cyclic 3'-phosphodiesterase